jgi:anti-sigma regulatory factor (Ser/Thr protein kinase)
MSGMRGLNGASDSESVFSRKRSDSRILEIDTWMPSDIHAISPTVDRLMRLIEGSQCVHGAERNVELTLREALGRAVVHVNQADSKAKVHIRCRCGPGNEISIVVTHQGKGFDFGKSIGNSLPSERGGKYGCGELMKVAIDQVSFERTRTEVRNGGTVCSSVSLKAM